jgi:hypothetical protein
MFPFTGQSRAPWSLTMASESEFSSSLSDQAFAVSISRLAWLPCHLDTPTTNWTSCAGRDIMCNFPVWRSKAGTVSERMRLPILMIAERMLYTPVSRHDFSQTYRAQVRTLDLLQAWLALQALQTLEGLHTRLLQSRVVFSTGDRGNPRVFRDIR